ncbi:hypothetical protein [Pseudomonas sp. MWU16-30323]|uniref:hypothetical protein n=1 Tax=Pseudomonas sp. MWU16-30323 TaxID=2878094 RepID=UPI001CFA4E5E|nr:hypothetical protein [Pseudomonas sp. MWU16-30323]
MTPLLLVKREWIGEDIQITFRPSSYPPTSLSTTGRNHRYRPVERRFQRDKETSFLVLGGGTFGVSIIELFDDRYGSDPLRLPEIPPRFSLDQPYRLPPVKLRKNRPALPRRPAAQLRSIIAQNPLYPN